MPTLSPCCWIERRHGGQALKILVMTEQFELPRVRRVFDTGGGWLDMCQRGQIKYVVQHSFSVGNRNT
jgi:hypothetical protein